MDANTTSVSDRGYQADMLWVKTINRHCVRGGGGRNVQRDGKNKRKKLVHLFPPQTEHAPHGGAYNALPRINAPQAWLSLILQVNV